MNLNNATDWAAFMGAIYGALQGLSQLVMLLAPTNTIIWKLAKYVTSGPQRPQLGSDAG